jgi:hypothetical protein
MKKKSNLLFVIVVIIISVETIVIGQWVCKYRIHCCSGTARGISCCRGEIIE